MTPSKRPLPGRPLPSTSLPKALLKKVAAPKPAPAKAAPPKPTAAKPFVPTPTLSKEATAAAAFSAIRSPAAGLPKGLPAARPAMARVKSGDGRKWRRRAAMAAVILLLCVGGAWAFGYFRHGNHMATIASLQTQMQDKNLSWDDRRALGRELQKQEKSLTQDERDKMRAQRDDSRDPREEQRLTKFFAMSAADQMKALDKEIDDQVKADQGNGNGRGGRGGGFGGGRGGPGGGDPNNSNAGRNRRLSSTPADVRAQKTITRELNQAYRNMVNTRATQRGINLQRGG